MKLQVHSTMPLFDNVANGRPFTDVLELNELVLHKLAHGTAIFFFTKKDDTIRAAIGTLREDLIRPTEDSSIVGLENTITKLFEVAAMYAEGKKDNKETVEYWENHKHKLLSFTAAIEEKKVIREQRKKKENKRSELTQVYFDLSEMAWKSFTKERLVALIDL
jgi:WYL domain-containing protein